MRILLNIPRRMIYALISLFLLFTVEIAGEVKPRERNILATEAKAINLAKVLITDNSWNKFPGYGNREFW